MKHYCHRDGKRYRATEMGVNHCTDCTKARACLVHHSSKSKPRELTIEEQMAKMD